MRRRLAELFAPPEGPSLGEVVRAHGAYPLTIITALNAVDELDRAVLAVFAPNIRRFFDIDNATLGAIVGGHVTLLILVGVPVGYMGTKVDRARILRWSAAVWSAFSAGTSLFVHLPGFVITRVGTGIGKAAVEPVGKSLLTDYYPPYAWNRVMATHQAANPIGGIVGPLGAGLIGLVTVGDAGWRWAFLILTIPSVIVLLAARRLREPESQMIRGLTAATITVTGAPSGLSFREAAGRLMAIPTFRRQLVGIGVLGFGLIGVLIFINVLLEEEFGVGEGGRGLVNGILATASLVGIIAGGRVGERLFHASPARSLRLVGLSIAAFSTIIAGAVFLPDIVSFVVVVWFAVLAISVAASPLNAALSAITEPRLRPLMFAMLGLFIGLFGGFGGGILVGAISDATNLRVGLASMFPFGVVGGLLMARAAETVEDDVVAVSRALGQA
jgi:MFS family permease